MVTSKVELAKIIENSSPGDVIEVPSAAMAELGERAAERTGKEVSFSVKAVESPWDQPQGGG